MPVGVELRPVERDQYRIALSDHVSDPPRQQLPDLDTRIAEQPVDLLDAMLALRLPGVRQSFPDGVDRERAGAHHAHRRIAQRQHPLGVQIGAENVIDEGVGLFR